MPRLAERLTCPPEINQHLADLCGVNVFGEPMFRLIWGMTETMQESGPGGYEETLVGHNEPCWILQKWTPPENYGTPEMYYYLMADPDYGLPILGEYPEFGRYETLMLFKSTRFNIITNEIEITTIDLDWAVIERAIPALIASMELTYWEKKTAKDREKQYENESIVQRIADELYDRLPSFYGPTSYRQQANRTTLLDRKKADIQRVWNRNAGRVHRPGFYQVPVKN